MSTLIATRGMQYPLAAEFTFNYNDTMKDVTGVVKDFMTVGTTVVDGINLPPNAIIISGSVTTETAVGGSTAYNVSVGDVNSATRYLGATDVHAAGIVNLVPTGYVGVGEQIRITVSPTVANATSGKVTVRISYIVRNRVNEAQTT